MAGLSGKALGEKLFKDVVVEYRKVGHTQDEIRKAIFDIFEKATDPDAFDELLKRIEDLEGRFSLPALERPLSKDEREGILSNMNAWRAQRKLVREKELGKLYLVIGRGFAQMAQQNCMAYAHITKTYLSAAAATTAAMHRGFHELGRAFTHPTV